MDNFKIEQDADGIALVTFDAPDKSMNTLTAKALAEIEAMAQTFKTDAGVKGVVFASGKPTGFCAGADLEEMLSQIQVADDEAGRREVFDKTFTFNRAFRALETCGKPVAVALEGLALGGGFELALACHYRVAADQPKLQLGLVESKIGLIPGGGGTQRLTRLIGAMAAAPLLLEGKTLRAQEALALKVVHEVVAPGGCIDACKAWIKAGGEGVAPWDRKDFKIPGGAVWSPGGVQVFIMGNAMVRKSTYGNYPAQLNIMRAVYEGLQVPIDAALRIESRYFARTVLTPQARAMIRTLFQSMQALGKGAARPAGAAPTDIRRAAVLGAGMMGAGIAHAAATAGLEVVLLDSSRENAEKGKAYSAKLLEKRVAKSQLSQDGAAAILARIHPTTDYPDLTGCELVVEAVFEDRALKADVTKQTEAAIAADAIFASNTSTLPITGLAEASSRPANFIGLHFFSPAEKMPLVEIILGKQTSPATLARAMDFVRAIGKTPIVVNDARGFYTSRVFGTYLSEGMALLQEGVAPALIDNAGRLAGMPVGPLALADEVSIELVHKIAKQTKADLGDRYAPRAADQVAALMAEKLGRFGKKSGHGFYDYPAGAKKHLWAGLAEHFPVKAEQPSLEQVIERLILIQSIETVRCLDEGVLASPQDADVGAILGWGYPPFRGGPIGQIHTMGTANFVAACDRLAEQCGERFRPTESLRKKAAEGSQFFPI